MSANDDQTTSKSTVAASFTFAVRNGGLPPAPNNLMGCLKLYWCQETGCEQVFKYATLPKDRRVVVTHG